MLNEQGLDHVWGELEAKSHDLFITEAGSCKLEIVKSTPLLGSSPSPPASTEGSTESNGKGHGAESASTTEELSMILSVCHPSSIMTMTFAHRGIELSGVTAYHFKDLVGDSLPLQKTCRLT